VSRVAWLGRAENFDTSPDGAIYRELMDRSRRPWPPAHLRAGDADRQAVVSELQQHYVEGRLNSEELGERVAQALNARTFGELSLPLADLPALHPEHPEREHPEPLPHTPGRGWQMSTLSPPLGAVLILVGLLALVWLFAFPSQHFGIFPFWPILIWGFFFIGRPRGGRRS
jgi:Domain of unknown function (DUF1707)